MSVVPTIADILLGQFQGESAVRWQGAYGAFCSQHSDSVTIYKDLYKSDRRKWPSYIFLLPILSDVPILIIVITAHRQNVLGYITTSISDPDPHWFGFLNPDPYWECGSGYRNKIIDQNSQIKTISSLSNVFCTYVDMFNDLLSTLYIWLFQFEQDPDPHWVKKLDVDPHWNQCGPVTLATTYHTVWDHT